MKQESQGWKTLKLWP